MAATDAAGTCQPIYDEIFWHGSGASWTGCWFSIARCSKYPFTNRQSVLAVFPSAWVCGQCLLCLVWPCPVWECWCWLSASMPPPGPSLALANCRCGRIVYGKQSRMLSRLEVAQLLNPYWHFPLLDVILPRHELTIRSSMWQRTENKPAWRSSIVRLMRHTNTKEEAVQEMA